MKFSHKSLIAISGTIWFIVGMWLMYLGMYLLLRVAPTVGTDGAVPLFERAVRLSGGFEPGVLVLLFGALLIGLVKARLVLRKTAMRTVARIIAAPNPTSLKTIFTPGYLILILLMMGLGMALNFLGIPPDIRGVIDVAVGAALLNGAVEYFRHVLAANRT